MRPLLTLLLILPFTVHSQTREELFDMNFRPTNKIGAYYFVMTGKKDTGWMRQAYFIAQKTLYMEGWYKDDSCTIKHGEFFYFHNNKKLRQTGRYVNNKKEGPWLTFDEDGRLDDSTNYREGRKIGIGLAFHDNGFLADSTNFDGAGNGVQVRWYDEGSLSAAGRWTNDTLKQGKWKYYHRNGVLKATEEYDENGKMLACDCFTEQSLQLDSAMCREKEASIDVKLWRRYMEKALLPLVEQKVREGIKGNFTVMVRFLVTEDGKIDSVKALTNYGQGIEEGVVRIIKNGPTWTPGRVHGRNVKSYHTQPVTFMINDTR